MLNNVLSSDYLPSFSVQSCLKKKFFFKHFFDEFYWNKEISKKQQQYKPQYTYKTIISFL